MLTSSASILSGGEKQRISIARALINNPSIIFADEHTGNLDSDNEKAVIEILKKLNREFEKTIIMVTHNIDLAKQSDAIVTLSDGKVVKADI
jgi:ABC-type lipoprotein export system ATPase subunit